MKIPKFTKKFPKIPDRLKLFLPGIIISLVILWVNLSRTYYSQDSNRRVPVAYARVMEYLKLPKGVYLTATQQGLFQELNAKFFPRMVALLIEADELLTQRDLAIRFRAFRTALERGEWGQKLNDSVKTSLNLHGPDELKLDRIHRQWEMVRNEYEAEVNSVLTSEQREFILARSENPKLPLPAPPSNLDFVLADMDPEDRANFPIKEWKQRNPELLQPISPNGAPSLKTIVELPKEETEESKP